MPADGHRCCRLSKRRSRYVAVFWAALQAPAGLYEALMNVKGVNSNTANRRGDLLSPKRCSRTKCEADGRIPLGPPRRPGRPPRRPLTGVNQPQRQQFCRRSARMGREVRGHFSPIVRFSETDEFANVASRAEVRLPENRVSRSVGFSPDADLEGDREHQSIWSLIDGSSSLQCRADRCLRRGVLVGDGRTGDRKTSQAATPQRVNVSNEVSRSMIVHRNLSEPGAFEQATELVGVGETKDRIARWHVGRRCCSNFGNGLSKQTLDTLPARIIPP